MNRSRVLSILMVVVLLMTNFMVSFQNVYGLSPMVPIQADSVWYSADQSSVDEVINLSTELKFNGDVNYNNGKIIFENNSTYSGASAFTTNTYQLDDAIYGMSFATSYAFSIDRVSDTLGSGGFSFIMQGVDNEQYSQERNSLGTGGLDKSLAIGIESTYSYYEDDWDETEDYFVNYTVTVIRNGDYEHPLLQETTANFSIDKRIEEGGILRAKIDYDEDDQGLNISIDGMASPTWGTARFYVPNLDLSTILVDDSGQVMKDVYIGFAGATGDASETCSIYDWYFDNSWSSDEVFYETINTKAEQDALWLKENLTTIILNGNAGFDSLTKDLYLPTILPLGTKVVWESSEALVLNNLGQVKRPIVDSAGIDGILRYYIITPLGLVLDSPEWMYNANYNIEYTVLKRDLTLEDEKINTSVYFNESIDSSELLETFGGGSLVDGHAIIEKTSRDEFGSGIFTANKLQLADDYSFSTYFKFNDSSNSTSGEGAGGLAFNVLSNGNKLSQVVNSLGTGDMVSSLNIGIVTDYVWVAMTNSQGNYMSKNYYLSVFLNGDSSNPIVYEKIDYPHLGQDAYGIINYDGSNQSLEIEFVSIYNKYSKIIDNVDLSNILLDENGISTRAIYAGFSGGTSELDQSFNISEWYMVTDDTNIFNMNRELEDTSLISIDTGAITYTTGSAITIKVTGNPDSIGSKDLIQGVKVDLSTTAGELYPSELITDSKGEVQCILLSNTDTHTTLSVSVEGGAFKEEFLEVKGYALDLTNMEKAGVTEEWLDEGIILNGNTSSNDVRTDIYLPANGPHNSVITWTIDNDNVIGQSGLVTRPLLGEGNQVISLSADVTVDDVTLEKTFILTVKESIPSNESFVDLDVASLTNDVIKASNISIDEVTADLYLPTLGANGSLISWMSDSWLISASNGSVTRPDYWEGKDGLVTLTATITNDLFSRTEEFVVTVKSMTPNDWNSIQNDSENWLRGDLFTQGNDTTSSVTQDLLSLPTRGKFGTIITWQSSNENLITHEGKVTLPWDGEPYQDVVLTATCRRGSGSVEVPIDFKLKKSEFSHEDIVELDYDRLGEYTIKGSNVDFSHIQTDINLPTVGMYGSSISWQSSDSSIVSIDGRVNRNAYYEIDEPITLTATIGYGSAASRIKSFDLVVLSEEPTDSEAVTVMDQSFSEEAFLNGNSDLSHIIMDLNMPTTGSYDTIFEWTFSEEGIVALNGVVSRPGFFEEDKVILITLEIKKGSESVKREYSVTVNKVNYKDDEIVALDLAELAFEDIRNENTVEASIISDMVLPIAGTYGSKISWSSSDIDTISLDGRVMRPSYKEEDRDVLVSATFSCGTANDETRTFDLTVLKTEVTDTQSIEEMEQALMTDILLNGNEDFEHIISNLNLPTTGVYGTTLVWESSDTNVVSNYGTVTRLEYKEGDQRITLTVVITKGGTYKTIEYELVVKTKEIKESTAVYEAYLYLEYDILIGDVPRDEIISDINLPTSYENNVEIIWQSSDSSLIKSDGSVIIPKEYSSSGAPVTLTAMIKCGAVTYTKQFYLKVKCIEENYLMPVTFSPRANSEDVDYTKKEITLSFDKHINLTKYKENIKVEEYYEYGDFYEEVPIYLTTEDNILTIHLQESLKLDTKYRVNVPNNSMTSDHGYYTMADYVWNFTVERQKYYGGFIASTSIEDGEKNLDISGLMFEVKFHEFEVEPVSELKIRYFEGNKFDEIKVVNKNTGEKAPVYGCMIVGNGLSIGMGQLEPGETYRIVVPMDAVVDYYGNSTFSIDITFSTLEFYAPILITSVYPADGSINVAINQDIEINFDKVIGSYEYDKVYIVNEDGDRIDTVISSIYKNSDDSDHFRPNDFWTMGYSIHPVESLKPNKSYEVVVELEAAKSRAGSFLDFGGEDVYRSNFSTGDDVYDIEIGVDNTFIGVKPEITLRFEDSVIMNALTSGIVLKTTNGAVIECDVLYKDKMLKITPKVNLDSQREYFIDIPPSAWSNETTGELNHGFRKKFSSQDSLEDLLISIFNHPYSGQIFPDTFTVFEPTLPYDAALFLRYEKGSCSDDVQYTWNFGDGTTSEEKRAVHKYKHPGEYEVVLHIDGGVYGSIEKTKKITVLDIENIDLQDVDISLRSFGTGYDDQVLPEYTNAVIINKSSFNDKSPLFKVDATLYIRYQEIYDWKTDSYKKISANFINLPKEFELQYQIYQDDKPIGRVIKCASNYYWRSFWIHSEYLQEGTYEMRFSYVGDSESTTIDWIPLIVRETSEKQLAIRLNTMNPRLLEEVSQIMNYEKAMKTLMPKQVIFNINGEDRVGYNNKSYDQYYVIPDLWPGNYTISISENDPLFKPFGSEFNLDLEYFTYKQMDAWVRHPNEIGIAGGMYIDKPAMLNQYRSINKLLGKIGDERTFLNNLDTYPREITIIEGVSREIEFEINVDWNGHEEGYIQYKLGDSNWGATIQTEDKHYVTFDLGGLKVGQRVMARAVSYDNEATNWIDLGITCVPIPPLVSNDKIQYTTYIEPFGSYDLDASLTFDGYSAGNIAAFDDFSILDTNESFGIGSSTSGLDISFDGNKAIYTIKGEDTQKMKYKSVGHEISGGMEVSLAYIYNQSSRAWEFNNGYIMINVIDKMTRKYSLKKVKIKCVSVTPKITTIITTELGATIFIDYSSGEPVFSGILDIDVGLDVCLDVSVIGTGLEVWGGGTVGAQLHIPTWYLQVDGSAYTKEIVKLFGLKWEIYYGEIYGTWNNGREKVGYKSNQSYLAALGVEEDVAFEPIGRSYLFDEKQQKLGLLSGGIGASDDQFAYSETQSETQSESEGTTDEGHLVKDNIYPYPEMKNVLYDDSNWVTYVDDNIRRDRLNRTETVLARVSDDQTLETIWLDSDGTSDFEPVIASTDHGVLVAWQDLNQLMEGEYDIERISQIENSCEISVTNGVYQSLSDEVTQLTLTNDDIYDHSPRLAADGDNGLLVWQKSTDEGARMAYSYFDGSGWSEESLISDAYMSIVNMDVNFYNDKGLVLYTLDQDGDFSTDEDREIFSMYFENVQWSQSVQLSNNEVMDTQPKSVAFMDDWFVTWVSGEDLNYKWLNSTDIHVMDNMYVQGDEYDLDINESLGLITFIHKGERVDQKDNLLLRTYDINQKAWSEERLIASEYDYIRDYESVILESGDMIIDFIDVDMITEVNVGGEVLVPSDDADWKELTLKFKHDLAIIEPINLSSEVPYKNIGVTINAVIDNVGDYSERAVITFYEGDPKKGGMMIGEVDTVDYIPANGQTEVSVLWQVGGEDRDYYDIYMNVESYNETVTNNFFVNRISSYNFSIENVAYKSYGEDEYLITAKVLNNSSNSSDRLTVELVDNNSTYSKTENIEVIEALQVYSVDFIVKSSDLILENGQYSITLNVKAKEGLTENNSVDNEFVLELEPLKLFVQSQNIADNEMGIPLDKEFAVTFNKLIIEQADYDKIVLRDKKLNVVDIETVITNNELVIKPKVLLEYGNQYELIIPDDSIASVSGFILDRNKTIVFYTENNMPEVVFTYPANGFVNVDVNIPIRIKFNQSIAKGVSYNDIELMDGDGNRVATSNGIDDKWLTITPTANLKQEMEYYLMLPLGSVKNGKGILLNSDSSIRFTTNDKEVEVGGNSNSTTNSSSETGWQVTRFIVGNKDIGLVSIISNNGLKKGVVVLDSELLSKYIMSNKSDVIDLSVDVDELEIALSLAELAVMREHGIVLQIASRHATYYLDPSIIEDNQLLKAFGRDVDINQLGLKIVIAETDEVMMDTVEDAVKNYDFELVGKAYDFSMFVEYEDQSEPIEQFARFTKRLIKMPIDTLKSSITAGITVDEYGRIRQVPIAFVTVNGEDYVAFYSMTNSTYMLIDHQVSYTDIDKSYAKDAIISLGEKYIIEDESTFNVKDKVTRVEVVKYLVKALGLKPEAIDRFEDVEKDSEDIGYIGVAYNLGITKGTSENTFDPNSYVTREQTMALIYRAAQLVALDESVQTNKETKDLSQYEDGSMVSEYAIDAIKWNLETGLIIGTSRNTLLPQDYLTKEEISMILYRFLESTNFNNK